MDDIDLNSLMGAALVVDAWRWEEDLQMRWHDGIVVVVVRTVHGSKWGSPEYVKGWPGVPMRLAEMCVERGVRGVMIDTMSADAHGSHDFPVHKLLLRDHGLWIVENAKLDWSDAAAPPRTGVRVVVMPMKIRGAPEAPVRVILSW